MPSKVVSYECCICKCRYTEWEEAKECEKIHKIPVIVADPIYKKTPYKCVREYPEAVLVAFNDDEVLPYYRRQ